MKKKLLAALLSASMVMGIAACGSNTATTETTTESADSQTSETTQAETATTEAAPAETAETAAAGIEGWEPFSDQVTLRVAVYDRGDNGNGCSDVENNYWKSGFRRTLETSTI